MKRLIYVLTLVLMLGLVGCANDDGVDVLRIYNWQDYIAEEFEMEDEDGNIITIEAVLDSFANWYKEETNRDIEIIYDTFATNEIMLNNIRTGKTKYDLACPSEYTIQRMIVQDMLEKMDLSKIPNYSEYCSYFLQDLFNDNGWDQYAAPYMWGTMGLVYNMDNVAEEDVQTWAALWNESYKNRVSAKDSVRDTYIIGALYTYREELMEYSEQYKNGFLSVDEYNEIISEIMNRTSGDSINEIEVSLKALKKNIRQFEIDNGKNDIVMGKIDIYLAWSGDAVYSMDVAEEENETYLGYYVPEEGSNVWFDGWVMPKGANTEIAQMFINFLFQPEIAVRNMNYIGYTSAVAGDEIFEMILDWYGVEEDEEGEEIDLTYFFRGILSEEYLTDGKAIVTVAERGRQFDAQYPSEDVIIRCGVMNDFKEQNNAVLSMWVRVKGNDYSMWWLIVVSVLIWISVASYLGYNQYRKTRRRKMRIKQ